MEKIKLLLRVLLGVGLMGCSAMAQKPPIPVHVPVYFGGYACNLMTNEMDVLKPKLKLIKLQDAYFIFNISHCWSA